MSKLMILSEFRDFGYLQEVNRQFLHPLGMALRLNAEYELDVIDARDDPEGMIFEDFDPTALLKARRVAAMQELSARTRIASLGYVVQPVPEARVEE